MKIPILHRKNGLKYRSLNFAADDLTSYSSVTLRDFSESYAGASMRSEGQGFGFERKGVLTEGANDGGFPFLSAEDEAELAKTKIWYEDQPYELGSYNDPLLFGRSKDLETLSYETLKRALFNTALTNELMLNDSSGSRGKAWLDAENLTKFVPSHSASKSTNLSLERLKNIVTNQSNQYQKYERVTDNMCVSPPSKEAKRSHLEEGSEDATFFDSHFYDINNPESKGKGILNYPAYRPSRSISDIGPRATKILEGTMQNRKLLFDIQTTESITKKRSYPLPLEDISKKKSEDCEKSYIRHTERANLFEELDFNSEEKRVLDENSSSTYSTEHQRHLVNNSSRTYKTKNVKKTFKANNLCMDFPLHEQIQSNVSMGSIVESEFNVSTEGSSMREGRTRNSTPRGGNNQVGQHMCQSIGNYAKFNLSESVRGSSVGCFVSAKGAVGDLSDVLSSRSSEEKEENGDLELKDSLDIAKENLGKTIENREKKRQKQKELLDKMDQGSGEVLKPLHTETNEGPCTSTKWNNYMCSPVISKPNTLRPTFKAEAQIDDREISESQAGSGTSMSNSTNNEVAKNPNTDLSTLNSTELAPSDKFSAHISLVRVVTTTSRSDGSKSPISANGEKSEKAISNSSNRIPVLQSNRSPVGERETDEKEKSDTNHNVVDSDLKLDSVRKVPSPSVFDGPPPSPSASIFGGVGSELSESPRLQQLSSVISDAIEVLINDDDSDENQSETSSEGKTEKKSGHGKTKYAMAKTLRLNSMKKTSGSLLKKIASGMPYSPRPRRARSELSDAVEIVLFSDEDSEYETASSSTGESSDELSRSSQSSGAGSKNDVCNLNAPGLIVFEGAASPNARGLTAFEGAVSPNATRPTVFEGPSSPNSVRSSSSPGLTILPGKIKNRSNASEVSSQGASALKRDTENKLPLDVSEHIPLEELEMALPRRSKGLFKRKRYKPQNGEKRPPKSPLDNGESHMQPGDESSGRDTEAENRPKSIRTPTKSAEANNSKTSTKRSKNGHFRLSRFLSPSLGHRTKRKTDAATPTIAENNEDLITALNGAAIQLQNKTPGTMSPNKTSGETSSTNFNVDARAVETCLPRGVIIAKQKQDFTPTLSNHERDEQPKTMTNEHGAIEEKHVRFDENGIVPEAGGKEVDNFGDADDESSILGMNSDFNKNKFNSSCYHGKRQQSDRSSRAKEIAIVAAERFRLGTHEIDDSDEEWSQSELPVPVKRLPRKKTKGWSIHSLKLRSQKKGEEQERWQKTAKKIRIPFLARKPEKEEDTNGTIKSTDEIIEDLFQMHGEDTTEDIVDRLHDRSVDRQMVDHDMERTKAEVVKAFQLINKAKAGKQKKKRRASYKKHIDYARCQSILSVAGGASNMKIFNNAKCCCGTCTNKLGDSSHTGMKIGGSYTSLSDIETYETDTPGCCPKKIVETCTTGTSNGSKEAAQISQKQCGVCN